LTALRTWLEPVTLAVLAAACGAGALQLGAEASAASPLGVTPAVTPVLSARRAPEVIAAPIADRRLHADLDAALAPAPSTTCVRVADSTGATVYDHNGELPLVPASTEKLLTATAALLAYGPNAQFHTRVYGVVQNGTVENLFIRGEGDPLLATPDYVARYNAQPQIWSDLTKLADEVVRAGVKRVTGSVVGDETRYDTQRYVSGWPSKYIVQHATGPLSALSVNDAYDRYPPKGDSEYALDGSPEPATYAAGVFTLLLAQRGVKVSGPPASAAVPARARHVIATLTSRRMRDIVAELLRFSDNNTAELLVKELAVNAGSVPGRHREGIATVRSLLEHAGIDLDGTVIADGSGLSLDNRVSCALLVALLQRADTGPMLLDRVAIAGRSGTLRNRYKDTRLAGKLRAKTGSLTSVGALAGELQAHNGGRFVFAVLTNLPEGRRAGDEAERVQDALVRILDRHPRQVDLAALAPEGA
jgi:D-alanyl-D-alanine carboxypeptidase/D-alanyl-D-alanine-endopeptidase (penicillin-binding protein 4)